MAAESRESPVSARRTRGYDDIPISTKPEEVPVRSSDNVTVGTSKKPELVIDTSDSASTIDTSRSSVRRARQLRYGGRTNTSSSPTRDLTAEGLSPRDDIITAPASPPSPAARPATTQPAKTNVMKTLYNFFIAPIVNYIEKRKAAAQAKFEANLVKSGLELHVPHDSDLSYFQTRHGYISAMSKIVEKELAKFKKENESADIVRLRRNIVTELLRPENITQLSNLIKKTSPSIAGGYPDVAGGAEDCFNEGTVRLEPYKNDMNNMKAKLSSIIDKEINKFRSPPEKAPATIPPPLGETLTGAAATAGPLTAPATPRSTRTSSRGASI